MSDNTNEAFTPSIQIITQYIKDFSFDNPNAPESLIGGWGAPETSIEISLSQNKITLGEELYESGVLVKITAHNAQHDKTAFTINLHYAATVAISNVPKENLASVIMVEIPKLLFPFMREIIASATNKGGYPPLYLTPVNFEELYLNEIKRAKEESNA